MSCCLYNRWQLSCPHRNGRLCGDDILCVFALGAGLFEGRPGMAYSFSLVSVVVSASDDASGAGASVLIRGRCRTFSSGLQLLQQGLSCLSRGLFNSAASGAAISARIFSGSTSVRQLHRQVLHDTVVNAKKTLNFINQHSHSAIVIAGVESTGFFLDFVGELFGAPDIFAESERRPAGE